MDLRNCVRCGKLYQYDGIHKVCPDCLKKDENDFQKVKDYLWDNPNSTIDKVSDETGVAREKIVKFIKDERIVAEGLNLDTELHCERCGAAISHGHYCDKCRQELTKGFTPDSKNTDRENRRKEEMYMKNRILKRKRNN